MRKSIYVVFLLISFISIHAYAKEQIPVEGEWDNERIRSFIPARPIVYISNNVLSVHLPDPLENLNIEIIDSNGLIVYQDCISSNESGYIHMIDLKSDCYTIMITHILGYLSGSFSMGQ
jgi:hypothetical protein